MNPKEVRGLFDYLIETRGRLLGKFREISWGEATKARGASWDSMLGIVLHILDNEDGWLRVAAQGLKFSNAPDRKLADCTTLEQLEADHERVTAQTCSILANVTEHDLERMIEIQWPDGGTAQRSAERIMMHTFVDETAHLGELVCLFWQLDVAPPYDDWLDYRVS